MRPTEALFSYVPHRFTTTVHVSYRLFWKTVAETTFRQVDVAVPAYTVDGLSPNSQYIVYIVAVSKNGKSLPSETLIAWTDPAYPAFVEVCDEPNLT